MNHLRKIKSFVRREGRMTVRQSKALETLWTEYGVDADGPFDFDALFGRTAPLVVEIGFGNGKSLLEMVQRFPERNYLGIEVYRAGVGGLIADLQEVGATNCRVICDDAVEVLSRCVADNTIDTFQIYFPDPWHKKRHHKRRLIQTPFVKLLHQKLKPGGKIHLATDWEEYAEQMMAVFSDLDEFENIAGKGNYYTEETERGSTRFQRRGERLGHGVWDLQFKKR